MALDRLTIDDMSDREFLLVLADVADGDGWAESEHIAQRLDLAHKAIASSRLSWLRRWGAVEREHERDEDTGVLRYTGSGKPVYTQRWRLTPEGSSLAFGKLRKGDQSALDKLRDDQMLQVTRWLSERTVGDGTTGKLVQREWRYGHARRDR
jgi:hypothetical protein